MTTKPLNLACPMCGGSKSIVKDSRGASDHNYRRRICQRCGENYTTHERVVVRLENNRYIPTDLYQDRLYKNMKRLRPMQRRAIEAVITTMFKGT